MWQSLTFTLAVLAATDAPAVPFSTSSSTEELVNWLLVHNRLAAAARARLSQARADVGQATTWAPNPSVGVAVGGWPLGDTNPRGLGLHETLNVGGQVSQTFELLKRGPRMRAAERALMGEHEASVALMGEMVADARATLAAVTWQALRTAALRSSLGMMEEILALERVRAQQGDISGNDVDRLQVEVSTLQADVTEAEADLQQAQGDCASLFAAPCPVPEPSENLLNPPAVPEGVDVDARVADRPDLRALRLGSQSAREGADAEGRRWVPDPTFTLGYTHDRFLTSGANPNVLMMGVSVPVPVFDQGTYARRKLEGRALELTETAAAMEERNRQQLSSLRARLRVSHSALSTVDDMALPRAEAVLDATLRAYRAGQVGMADLLLARRARGALLLRRLELLFQRFILANDIRRTLGVDADVARGLMTRD